jgi:hypothetical protein
MIDANQDPEIAVPTEVKRDRTQRKIVTLALVLTLLAVAVYLVVASSPLANAAGGCGGG